MHISPTNRFIFLIKDLHLPGILELCLLRMPVLPVVLPEFKTA